MTFTDRLLQSVSKFLLVSYLSTSPLIAAWSPPETLPQTLSVMPTDAAGIPAFAHVAVDASGNATAVWVGREEPHGFTVQASSKPLGGDWQPVPDTISSPSISIQYPPLIVVDPNGNATVIWQEFGGPNYTIQASSKPFGGSWGSPVPLASNLNYSDIAVDPHGNVMVAWTSLDVSSIIQIATKPFNENWQPAVSLTTTPSAYPQLALDNDGNATVVYLILDGPNPIVQTRFRPIGGDWEAPINLTSALSANGFPQISVGSNGNPTVVWPGSDGTSDYILASTRQSPTSWEDPVIISYNGTESFPEVFVDSNNNITAVWSTGQGSSIAVQGSTKFFGENWGTPVTITSGLFQFPFPHIAGDSNGNVTAVWSAEISANSFVAQAASKPFRESWSPVVNLSATAENFGEHPQLAVDPMGNATAVWGFPFDVNYFLQSAINLVAPSISDVSPNAGPEAGGTSVTITGTNFIGVTGVFFGSTPASSFQVISPTSIVAIAPPGTSGTVNITITSSLGNSSITVHDQFTYQHLPPLPPTHFTGKISKRHHEHKHPYTLHAQWKQSQSTVAFYRIYKRSKVVDEVQANAKRSFKDHLQWRSSTKKFSITAVDSTQAESVHIPLKTHH